MHMVGKKGEFWKLIPGKLKIDFWRDNSGIWREILFYASFQGFFFPALLIFCLKSTGSINWQQIVIKMYGTGIFFFNFILKYYLHNFLLLLFYFILFFCTIRKHLISLKQNSIWINMKVKYVMIFFFLKLTSFNPTFLDRLNLWTHRNRRFVISVTCFIPITLATTVYTQLTTCTISLRSSL